MTDSVADLYEAVLAARQADPATSRTARLLRAGRAKMAKKLAEEAVEVVIDAMEDGESRSIGSSNIQSWQKRGMVGLVTSGGLADTDEIIHQKVPVYFRRLARGIRPGRNELESVNRPVTVGGVLVRPGDVVMADGDGVVVVPREHAADVADAALPFLDNIGRERYIKETGKNPWKK